MSHDDVLKLLAPLRLEGAFDGDVAVEAAQLDTVLEQADALLLEMFSDTSTQLLSGWERVLGIVPAADSTVLARQQIVTQRLNARGDIKRPHFVAMAAAMGYEIRIDDYTESMAGWLCAGDELLEEPWRYLEAGIGNAGDTLAYEDPVLPWCWEVIVITAPVVTPSPSLEEVLQDLKPGHVHLVFTYL